MKKGFLHNKLVLAVLLLGGFAGNAAATSWPAPYAGSKAEAGSIAGYAENETQTSMEIQVGDDGDGKVFDDFDDALANANTNNKPIILLTDAKSRFTNYFYINIKGCRSIDLNGHTLTVNATFSLAEDGGTVFITDSKGNGRIVGDFSSNSSQYRSLPLFRNTSSATLAIKGGTFATKGSHPGKIYEGGNDGGKLVIYDGTFETNDQDNPFVPGNGSVEIYGGNFPAEGEERWNGYVCKPYKTFETGDGTLKVMPSDKVTLSYGDGTSRYLTTDERGIVIDTGESDADYTTWLSKMTIGEDLANVKVTLKRNFADGHWNALYLPYAITATADMLDDFDVAEIWDTELVDGATTIEFKTLKEGESIASYTPLIVRPRNGATELTATATTIEAAPKAECECSTIKQRFTFYGVLENTRLNENHGYYLDANSNAMAYATNTSRYVTPFKFYMTAQDKATGQYIVPTAQQSRVAIRVVGADPTGISGTSAGRGKTGDNRVFSLQGKVVGTQAAGLPKGIYIQNGRKILVK